VWGTALSFKAYRQIDTGSVHYAFEGEEHRLPRPPNCLGNMGETWMLFYEVLPNNPSTILATSTFMTEMPYLDSMKSMYELDRILNIEAEQDREDKAYQELMLQI